MPWSMMLLCCFLQTRKGEIISSVFTDLDNDDNAIAFSVANNSNDSLVTANINNNNLILEYQDDRSGTAEITVQGESNGKTVEDSFTVTVNPVDDVPVVNNAITDVTVNEDAENTVIDLSNVFIDIDNDNSAIRLVRKQATLDKPMDRGFCVEQWFK